MKKQPLTLEEHRELGQKIKIIYDEVQGARGMISASYSDKDKHATEAMAHLGSIFNLLLKAKDQLDEQVKQDMPSLSDEDGWKEIYYA